MTDQEKSFEIQQLISNGRKILQVEGTYWWVTEKDFNDWETAVADWLDNAFPGSALSGDWVSLEGKKVERSKRDRDQNSYKEVIRIRLGWLANLAKSEAVKYPKNATNSPPVSESRKVFVVHGHDEALRESVARLLETLNLIPIILHEQPNKGHTIIEKFMSYSDVSFAVVLLTPDDLGGIMDDSYQSYKPRARQNVIFELGFFLGRLGRDKVCALYKEGVDIPSDYQGILFVKVDTAGAWRLQIAREINEAGILVDLNRLK